MAVCLALVTVRLLTGPALVLSLLVVTALGLMLHPPHFRVPSPRARRWWAGAAGGIALVVVLVVAPSRISVGSDLLPLTSTTWYYANLAQSMASAGRIPSGLAEWGSIRPFQTDYLPVTAHTAGAMLLLPGDVVTDLEIYRLVILGIGIVLCVLLLRRWFSVWAALLGTVLLFSTILLAQKFDGYRPETVAFDLLLFTLWLADRAIVERSRRVATLAVVSSALVFLAHAEVFLVLGAALPGIGLARAIVVRGSSQGDRVGLRIRIGRSGVRALGLSLGLIVGGLGLGTLVGLASTGDTGVFGYLRAQTNGPAAVTRPDPSEIPAGWTFSGDPTWDFYVAAVAPNFMGMPPPATFRDARLLPRTILRVWTSLDGRNPVGMVALIGLGAVLIVAWPRLDARRRRAIVVWLTFGVLLFIGSFALFSVSGTYVPRRTGGVRLLPYLVFIPVLSATLLLWGVGRWNGSVVPARLGTLWRPMRPRRPGRVVLATLALIAVWLVGAAKPITGRQASLTPTGNRAFQWIRDNLPSDARVLANGYTDGSIAAVTGRVGITDGRAVYLEEPEFLAESTALCLGARAFFANPTAPAALSFLARERVSYLVVATAGPFGRDIGGYPLFSTNLAALATSRELHLTRSFGDGRILIYEVADSS
jgi:hypothetical protein